MIGVSVIVCCHNSEKRLPETLKHLAFQLIPEQLNWEVIVINNNSTDHTNSVSYSEWAKYNLAIEIKVIDESKPGLSAAREKGFFEARYDYVLFCDDDNWLSENYVSNAFNIIHGDATIGVLGGCGIFEPELPVNSDIAQYASYFVNGPQTWAEYDHWVYGAGAVYRKKVYLELKRNGWKQITSDRIAKKLISGGDVEICFMFYLLGYRIIADDRLQFQHFVPLNRQTLTYILNLSFWINYSYVFLHCYVVLINNDQRSIKDIYSKWSKSLAKTTLQQLKLLIISKLKPGKNPFVDEKINLQKNLGILYSIFRNQKKISLHHACIKSLLKDATDFQNNQSIVKRLPA
ncbi:glycosyltransferase [Daejeonella oryzae]|uniref:glycosyltransferase n=1 Tax=Daejeonella oryzae TaxID=1122943 RepID=UPI000405A29B|nr:glycosyltransferase [Daejeonella oryzae]